MLLIFLISNLVFLQEDSLIFKRGDEVIDVWWLEFYLPETVDATIHYRRAKINPDQNFFIISYEQYDKENNVLRSEIELYDARQRLKVKRIFNDGRIVFFDLMQNSGDKLFLVEQPKDSQYIALNMYEGKKSKVMVPGDEWKRIVSFVISPNQKYLAAHVRKPYMNELWDHVYFRDIKTGQTWQYRFPLCLSCKRTRINLEVDDQGQTDIEYKGEHRVFSKEGNFIDYYIGHKNK